MITNWPGRATRAVLLAGVLLGAAACGDDGTDTAETGADEGASTAEETGACTELPRLHVVNGTGNAIEEITMVACDMSEQNAYPVPPGGLPDGGELTISLPGPGCWILGYTGEGCFGDPPGMVEAACGETVEWALTPENHVCAGF